MPSSTLAYHDYIVLVALLDESHSFRIRTRDQKLFREVSTRFTTACCNYRHSLEANCNSYARVAAHLPADVQPDKTLYNPISYTTFGRSDYAAIVLLDAFNPALAITMDVRSPIESISVGFCPQIDKLSLSDDERRWFTTFPALMYKGAPAGHDPGRTVHEPKKAQDDGHRYYVPAKHPFQRTTPLVALTSFRLNGPAFLGEGLALSRAIYRAIARRINDTLAAMRKHYSHRRGDPTVLVAPHDIDSFRCCLIEPQGADDVLLFMACTNYSVPATVITALRALLLVDVLSADDAILRRLEKYIARDAIFGLCKNAKGWEPDLLKIASLWESAHPSRPTPEVNAAKLAELLPGNHLFARSVTTLGATFDAFDSPAPYAGINGFIEPIVNLDISSGHDAEVQRNFFEAIRGFLAAQDRNLLSVPLGLYAGCSHMAVGAHERSFAPPLQAIADLTLRQTDLRGRLLAYAVPTATYIAAVRHVERACCGLEGIDRGNEGEETGLMDLTSSIVVPFQSLHVSKKPILPRCIDTHIHAPLQSGLRWMRDRLCPNFEQFITVDSSGNDERKTGPGGAIFQLSRLDGQMQALEVPRPLRRTLSFLFHDFVSALSDTETFHAVVDLYDVFVTLYKLLTVTEILSKVVFR